MKKYAIILRGINQNLKKDSVVEISGDIRTKVGAEGWLRVHTKETLTEDKVVHIGYWDEIKTWLKQRLMKAADSFYDVDREEISTIGDILAQHKDEQVRTTVVQDKSADAIGALILLFLAGVMICCNKK